ncbi:MAG: ISAzo13-like element transposase-related protein, partial [Terriglobia bacterium]
GSSHPDRNAQFQYLAHRVEVFQQQGQPVISVDAKKKEHGGISKTADANGSLKASRSRSKLHDFGKDKVTPYGVWRLDVLRARSASEGPDDTRRWRSGLSSAVTQSQTHASLRFYVLNG